MLARDIFPLFLNNVLRGPAGSAEWMNPHLFSYIFGLRKDSTELKDKVVQRGRQKGKSWKDSLKQILREFLQT